MENIVIGWLGNQLQIRPQELEKLPELLDFDLVLNTNDEGTSYEGLEIWDTKNHASVCYINLKNRTVTVCPEYREGPRTFNYLECEENFEEKDYWK